ncbi:T9SS type A sorting domain-containing protein, partial [bacterium]|nr:T9SS type A sorting domain-containing protein [bacterium]
VYKGATLLGSPIMNGGGMGMGCGFFMLNYVAGVPGSDWWCEIEVSPSFTYTSRYFTTVDGPQSIAIVQDDWSCEIGPSEHCVNILCALDEEEVCTGEQIFSATIWTSDPACLCDEGGTVHFTSEPIGATIITPGIDFPAESFFDVFYHAETPVGPGTFGPGDCFELVATVVFNSPDCPDLECREYVCVDANGFLYRYPPCDPGVIDVPLQMSVGGAYCFHVCHDVYWIPLTCQLPGPPIFQIIPGCDGPFPQCNDPECVPGGPNDFCWDKLYCPTDGLWYLRFEYSNPNIEPVCYCVFFEDQLPVELNLFEAVPGDRAVTLNWSTATEMNNDHFEIARRASETGNFTIIQEVPGSGTKSTETNYTYIDRSVINEVTYYYQLTAVDINGQREVQDIMASATPTAGVVTEYALHQCYPNPFNPVTEIRYDLAEGGMVKLAVFDVLGRQVASLVSTEQSIGRYSVRFDASHLATGVYLYQLQVNDFTTTKKMLYLK